jgi:hypothetical protein
MTFIGSKKCRRITLRSRPRSICGAARCIDSCFKNDSISCTLQKPSGFAAAGRADRFGCESYSWSRDSVG